VTSEEEAAAGLSAGITTTAVTIPFGVELPSRTVREAIEQTRDTGPDIYSRKPQTALFLGRIHPIKNLRSLIEAFADARLKGWRLQIVGPDEVGHQAELEELARRLGVASLVFFEQPTYGDAKARLLAQASVLVLPSFTENFGMVVAEALVHGVPAIASTGAPWRALETERCGWWIPPTREAIADALGRAASLDPSELVDMGDRGRAYAEASLTWSVCAKNMAVIYRALRH
jgi:glycosyltransferase involved in cell wall biosynthesis